MVALRTNRPTLDALRHMPVSDVIALPAEHLALLQIDAREALDAAKRIQDWIEAAPTQRRILSGPTFLNRASWTRRSGSGHRHAWPLRLLPSGSRPIPHSGSGGGPSTC